MEKAFNYEPNAIVARKISGDDGCFLIEVARRVIPLHSPHSKSRLIPSGDLCRLCMIAAAAMGAFGQPANPPPLDYATYSAPQRGQSPGLAVDAAGFVYVSGALDSGCGFLTKLSQAGSTAVWSVCLPMSQVNAVALDDQAHIYIAGTTQGQQSSTATIMKLSQDAQQTLYSTTVEGADATDLVLDRAGNAYVSGWADASFKATPRAYLTARVFTHVEAFALKLDTSGAIQYATYLDLVHRRSALASNRIAVDSNGSLWVGGSACPPSGERFSNCDVGFYGSSGVIRKLDSNGEKVLVSKTLGFGSSFEGIWNYNAVDGVAVGGDDSVWVVGSTESSVPTTPDALQPTRPPVPTGNAAQGFAYATKLSSSGDLLYGTYLGSGVLLGSEFINSVALDGQGRPHFALNLRQALNSTIMILSADGLSVLASTDLNSPVRNVALGGGGGLYVSGTTTASVFLTTPGSYQALFPGGPVNPAFQFPTPSAGYVARFNLTLPAAEAQFSTVVSAAGRLAGYRSLLSGGAAGAVAPGEIVSLLGKNLPSDPSVTFDGRPAPILYADANQINAVVPFEVSAPGTVVSLQDVRGYVLPVQLAVPALFTADQSGTGQLAALNDDGTANSRANPAKAGSVISVFMTGAGAMTPSIGTGELGPIEPPYPVPNLTVSARLKGADAPVVFVGQAPGLIAGLVRVDLQVPEGTAAGSATLQVNVGSYQTQLGLTTISVQ